MTPPPRRAESPRGVEAPGTGGIVPGSPGRPGGAAVKPYTPRLPQTPAKPSGPVTRPTESGSRPTEPIAKPTAPPMNPGGSTTRPGGTRGSGAGGRPERTIGTPGRTIKPAPPARTPPGNFVNTAPREDFSRPLVSSSTPSGTGPVGRDGGDRWRGRDGRDGDWRHDGGRHHGDSSFNFSLSLGIGTFFCPPPPPIFNHCFTTFYDPFVFRSRFCGLPLAYYNYYRYHGFHSSFFFYDCDPCFPSWRSRPVYVVDNFPCGSYYGVRYHDNPYDYSFRFSDTPCDTFSSCSLVSSANWTWSTHGVYRYGWFSPPSVTTIVNDAPVEPSLAIAVETIPAVASADELRSTTQRELGDVYMRLGDLANAIRVYGDHVDAHPGDVRALRSLGVALIAADRAQEGVARIDLAYRIDPGLAQRPFLSDILSVENGIDRITESVALLAATEPSAESWLTLAVLKQAQGQSGPARAALEKAEAAGLAQPVIESMRAALPLENRN